MDTQRNLKAGLVGRFLGELLTSYYSSHSTSSTSASQGWYVSYVPPKWDILRKSGAGENCSFLATFQNSFHISVLPCSLHIHWNISHHMVGSGRKMLSVHESERFEGAVDKDSVCLVRHCISSAKTMPST